MCAFTHWSENFWQCTLPREAAPTDIWPWVTRPASICPLVCSECWTLTWSSCPFSNCCSCGSVPFSTCSRPSGPSERVQTTGICIRNSLPFFFHSINWSALYWPPLYASLDEIVSGLQTALTGTIVQQHTHYWSLAVQIKRILCCLHYCSYRLPASIEPVTRRGHCALTPSVLLHPNLPWNINHLSNLHHQSVTLPMTVTTDHFLSGGHLGHNHPRNHRIVLTIMITLP